MDNEELFTDREIDEMVDSIDDLEDILYAYDDNELESEDLDESTELNEILSRGARIQAKFRMKRTKVRRELKKKMVLKRRSNNDVLAKRARRIAIKMMKSKLLKKNLNKASFNDKVRVETLIKKRKAAVDRLARKLMPKVRQIETKRLSFKAQR